MQFATYMFNATIAFSPCNNVVCNMLSQWNATFTICAINSEAFISQKKKKKKNQIQKYQALYFHIKHAFINIESPSLIFHTIQKYQALIIFSY